MIPAPGSDQEKKVLILTSDTGLGHRSASNAVAEALSECYGPACRTIILNPILDRPAPYFLRKSMKDYDQTVRRHPAAFRFSYEAMNLPALRPLLERILNLLLVNSMVAILQEVRPDAVLSTYHIFNAPMGAALAACRLSIPFHTAITDLAKVHTCWFNPTPAKFYLPTAEVRAEALAAGIPAGKIVVSGIPVNPQIGCETRQKSELRLVLGWEPGLATLLVVGSRRVKRLLQHLEALDRCASPFQIVFVAGGDGPAYRQARAMSWRHPVRLYDFVDNLPTMLHAADLLVCKAGGLMVAEGLACGLPILLIDAIEGQETGNVAYVISHQAGCLVRSPEALLALLDGWPGEGAHQLDRYAKNARQLGRPEAAYQVARSLWQSVQERNTEKTP